MVPRLRCAKALALAASLVLLQRAPSATALRLESKTHQGSLRAILAEESSEGRLRRTDSMPTLYCFMVVRPGSHEVDTLRVHLREKSLSGCDGYTVYSNVSLGELLGGDLSPEDLQLFGPHEVPAVEGSMESKQEGFPPEKPVVWSASNTDLFIRAWKHIWREGLFRNYDWTLKVDPDTLLVPDRMRLLLRDQTEKVAIINGGESQKTTCPPDRGMGGLVALTSRAVDGMRQLYDLVGTFDISREDGLLVAYCKNLPNCKFLDEPNFKQNCVPAKDSGCGTGWKAAYHAMKDPDRMTQWIKLIRNSTESPDPSKLHTTCL